MADQSTTATTEQAPSPDEQTREAFIQEVRDAALLLEFAVSQGRVLDATLILRIKKGQGFLSDGVPWPSDQDRSDFEAAYRDLAQSMKPVTAATLRATLDAPWKPSPARRFSKRLYIWVFFAAAFIVADQVLTIMNPPPPTGAQPSAQQLPTPPAPGAPAPGAPAAQKTGGEVARDVSHAFLPFVFGLVGALTFLLRSAHSYIAERTFDLNRRPEYYNRMVLGFLGGGIALLFIPSTATVGQNAVSFLVGYNTDYLFQMIERLAQAIFPKESKAEAAAAVLAGISLERDTLSVGDAGNATISVTGVAPAGGLLVTLTADDGIELQGKTVKIPEGANSASFTFKVGPNNTAGMKLHITAKQDSSSMTATVTVK
jgi:hypothetical protein